MHWTLGKSVALMTQPVAYENELLKVRPEESENQYHS